MLTKNKSFIGYFMFYALVLLVGACTCIKSNQKEFENNQENTEVLKSIQDTTNLTFNRDSLVIQDTGFMEKQMIQAGLINIHTIDSSIMVDLKYNTRDNILNVKMYDGLSRAYMPLEVAEKLKKAQQLLQAKYPYYTLIIFDAARPHSVQKILWDSVKLPRSVKSKYIMKPDQISGHNYGTSIDVSIYDVLHEQLLDMGSVFDYLGEESEPKKELFMLAQGKITEQHIHNRAILRTVMLEAGFTGITSEWWHFNAMSRKKASEIYSVIP